MVHVLVSVPGGQTTALEVPFASPLVARAVLGQLEAQLPLGPESYMLAWNNQRFECDDTVPLGQSGPLPILTVMVKGGLRGGKGGFGAMLRSMGKGAGSKQTTDFGACRDLYGRRLRHVNDEIRLKKWLEDKEREEQDKDRKRDKSSLAKQQEKTPSGIAGWYLSVPGWAEIRPGKQGGYMKLRRKTALCRQWLDARQTRLPPRNAPRWWGCPRGRECDWAHGEEELRGQGLADLQALKKEEAARISEASQEAYVSSAGYDGSAVQSAVMEGLKKEQQARKKGKSGPLELHAAEEEEGSGKARILPVGYGAETWSVIPAECAWLEVVSGQMDVQADGTLRGGLVGEFATAAVVGASLQAPGSWYYEVEVLAIEGPMQVGWATQYFEADANEGDGVGDDLNSWAYDGVRVKAWNAENEKDYGRKWEVGDVVGCLLCLDGDDEAEGGGGKKKKAAKGEQQPGGYVRYYLNGQDLGKAFTGLKAKAGTEAEAPALSYYPALSLESGDAVRVNIGLHQPFKFSPTHEAGQFKGIGDSLDMVLPAPASKPSAVESAPPATSSTTSTPAAAEDKASSEKKQKKKEEAAKPAAAEKARQPPASSNGKQAAPAPAPPKKPAAPVKPQALDLSKYGSQEELEGLGLDRLKAALMAMELKCGGTLQERAARLWSVKGLKPDEIDDKLKAGKKTK